MFDIFIHASLITDVRQVADDLRQILVSTGRLAATSSGAVELKIGPSPTGLVVYADACSPSRVWAMAEVADHLSRLSSRGAVALFMSHNSLIAVEHYLAGRLHCSLLVHLDEAEPSPSDTTKSALTSAERSLGGGSP